MNMSSIIFTVLSKQYEREIERAAERRAERAAARPQGQIPVTGSPASIEGLIQAGERVWGRPQIAAGPCRECLGGD